MIRELLHKTIEQALAELGVPHDMAIINLDVPTEQKNGDYATNVAMMLFKSLGASSKSPFELAEKIVEKINKHLHASKDVYVEKVEAVKPGFINFFLAQDYFIEAVQKVLENPAWYGKNKKQWNKKVIIEHTNFNPFKPIHIGHLVNNAVGESLSRIFEFQGIQLTRASYGGDVGLHVGKALWGIEQLHAEFPQQTTPREQVAFIGKAYAYGAEAYETNEQAKAEIQTINKKVYEQSDEHINELYTWGRTTSFKYFESVYAMLGTRFDHQFWESDVADEGLAIVKHFLDKDIFQNSEGAVIFPGEKYGLHNRVFINSQGLPTYEAKEMGLTKKKFEINDFDQSVIVTANEQDDYFKVIIETLKHVYPEIGTRTKHISHGLLRLTTGKMSSRKGTVVTMESLLEDLQNLVLEKIQTSEQEKQESYTDIEKKDISEKVALAAMRYTVLRQAIGRDTVFDPEKSLSFEGDSGPYLQYTYVRTKAILKKAEQEKIAAKIPKSTTDISISDLERKIALFPDIVERAGTEYAPQYIATYLIELAGAFNAYYAQTKIVDKTDKQSGYKVALTEAVSWTLKNGMYLLGIDAPDRM